MGLFNAKPVLVVDATAVLRTKGVRGRPAPRQQLQILRTFSRLVQRENVRVTAVLSGKPLDKAPHNKVSEGVRVRYAKSDENVGKELLKAVKASGTCGVLVTDDISLEKRVLRDAGSTLRISTFRKLLDDAGDASFSGNGGGDNGGGQRSGGRRPQRRKKNPPKQQQQKAQKPAQPKGDKNDGNDAISQMIDLID